MNNYIEHTRNREYMSGVDRDKLRIKQTAEVFYTKFFSHRNVGKN